MTPPNAIRIGPLTLSPARAVALGVSVLWVLLVLVLRAALPDGTAVPGPGLRLAAAMAVLLPLGLIWLAALGIEEARALRADLRAMERRAVAENAPDRGASVKAARPASPARAPAPTAPAAPRPAVKPAKRAPVTSEDAAQGSLPLAEPQAPPPRLSARDVTRALNFPDSPDDTEGFRALRAGLAHPETAEVIQAAQDMLTLLADDDIYVDDMSFPDPNLPLWRRFAEGVRGKQMEPLGRVTPGDAPEQIGSRMRADAVFRDCAHHFLRRFDRLLGGFAAEAPDAALYDLMASRSGRAFVLVGQATGSFGALPDET